MHEEFPSRAAMIDLIGQPLFEVWRALCSAIDEKYDMERSWNSGGKRWTYEYKYRRGGKTLCWLSKEGRIANENFGIRLPEAYYFDSPRERRLDFLCIRLNQQIPKSLRSR